MPENPGEESWVEKIPDKFKYRVRLVNVRDQTHMVIESFEFGKCGEKQFAAYYALKDSISQAIASNHLPSDQCPQYIIDEDGRMTIKPTEPK